MHSGSPLGLIENGQNPLHSPIEAINNSNFRQIVSSSAPTSSFDLEAFVRRGAASSAGAATGSGGGAGNAAALNGQDSDFFRDRRKKDIHNMSKYNFVPYILLSKQLLWRLMVHLLRVLNFNL